MSETNTPETSIPSTSNGTTEVLGMQPNTYCMLLHLSQLLNCCVPPCGIIAPIVMWAIGKDKNVQIDQHGKIALNWIISCFIYWIITAVLCVVLIGFLLVPVLLVLTIVFPIIGAVKANDGVAWKYPLCIPFFK